MKSDSRDFILLGKTYKVVCRAMCVKLLRASLLHYFRNSHQVYTSCETFAPNSFVKSTLVHFVNINLCLRKYLSIKICLASSICKALHITFLSLWVIYGHDNKSKARIVNSASFLLLGKFTDLYLLFIPSIRYCRFQMLLYCHNNTSE